MFLCKLISPRALVIRQTEIVLAAIDARAEHPTFGIYTDGLFDADVIAVLVPETGSEEVRALLGDGWQPCDDAEIYEWSVWFGPLPTIKGPLLRLYAPWEIEKHYSRRASAISSPMPLFEAA